MPVQPLAGAPIETEKRAVCCGPLFQMSFCQLMNDSLIRAILIGVVILGTVFVFWYYGRKKQ
jgi:hypothetical protein